MMAIAWRALAGRLTGRRAGGFAARAKLALILPLGLAMAATAAADTVPQVTLATPGSSTSRCGMP